MRLIIANAHIKGGMSGSDNIYLHFADKWNAEVWNMLEINFRPFWVCYLCRIIRGCSRALLCRKQYELVYSASDFWMDSIPGFIMKMKGNKWIAGFYLFAPKSNRVYWLTQKLSYWLIQKYADHVFITSEPDRARFLGKKVSVVRGGIDMPSNAYPLLLKDRIYDAIFIGRLHPQKGLMALIEIWTMVSRMRPYARLVIVGDGPLDVDILREIRERKLRKNIIMLGYQEGQSLETIIKNSRICLHPATYDSGGMAACQAMAYGLPVIGWDLEAYQTYYPKGMIKVDKFIISLFVMQILKLLDSTGEYMRLSNEARAWARENSWPNMLNRIEKELSE